MGSRHVYRIVLPHAREIQNQRASIFDRVTTSRLGQCRLFASAPEFTDVTVPKAPDAQLGSTNSGVLKTHSSTVLIPPQKEASSEASAQLKNDSRTSTSDRPLKYRETEQTRSSGQNAASSSSANFAESPRVASATGGVRKSSIDKKETAKFAAISATWWDHKGPYKPLHIMNPTRVSFIRSAICKYFGKDANSARPLDNLQILDVGCGGGLVCEPLARMGGNVTGVDAVEENIGVASIHAARDPATTSIRYLCTTAEQLVQEQQKFDVVIALEVIEHVADPEDFCRSLAALAKEDGLVFISTLNRSLPSFGLAIVAAEYILRWLPQGTHEWSKFVTPEELSALMDRASISVEEVSGMVYNPLTQRWSLSSNTSVNYIAYGVNRSKSL